MIPKTPEYYVSRNETEESIRVFLLGRPSHSILQVIGLGGIGKTTMVAKVLFDNNLMERAIWLNLYNEPNAKDSIRNLSKELEKRNDNSRPIIILDGADTIKPDKLNVYLNHLRDKFIFPKLIITSRIILNRNDSKILALDSFSKEQTKRLLQFWKRNQEEIDELHQIAQGHPLALNLLNSTLNEFGIESIRKSINFNSEPNKEQSKNESQIIKEVQPKIITLNSQIVQRIKQTPQDVYRLTSREYEELIAELVTDFGWKVELTPQSRDGGKDILASYESELGKHLCLIECKKYSWERPIGVSIIRELYGTLMDHQANSSLLVTSSRFSPDAIKFQQRHEYLIGLRDYFDVLDWISDY